MINAGLECFDCNLFQQIWIIQPWIGISTLIIVITSIYLLYRISKRLREEEKKQ